MSSSVAVKYCSGCHQIIALGHAPWCRLKDRKPKPEQPNLLQMPLGFSGPLARATDPDTSHAAGEALTQKRLTEIQTAVLAWFREHEHGTDEQIEDALKSRYSAFSTLRKRRCDLVSLGYLHDSAKREMNRNGRMMIVWELIA